MAQLPTFYMTTGQYLRVGEYLASDNGLFIAIMQPDRNFVVYRANSPDDVSNPLWATNTSVPGSDSVFAVIQDDGNFVIYNGTSPQDTNWAVVWAIQRNAQGGQFCLALTEEGELIVTASNQPGHGAVVWRSGATDPVETATGMSLEYDLANAQVSAPQPVSSLAAAVDCDNRAGAITQTQWVTGTIAVQETSSFSTTWTNQIQATISGKVSLPLVADGKVQLSVTETLAFQWTNTISTTQTFSYSFQMSTPAGARYRSYASVMVSTIDVPFFVTFQVTLKSGLALTAKIPGIYRGKNGHNLMSAYERWEDGTWVSGSTQEITPAIEVAA